MKKIFLMVALSIVLVGCASTSQPQVGTRGIVEDKTLNNNTVDLLTLLRVQNNYGTQYTIVESDRGHK